LDKYTWTEPYVDNSQVFVVKKDSGIKTKADLKGKTVLVQKDSSALEALESKENKALTDSFKNLDQVPEYNTAFLNLEAGSGDVIAMDIGVANYQIASRGSDKFEILSDQLSSEKYGIGFKLGNEELRDKVQKSLKEMVKDGTMKKIAQKYSKYNLEQCLCLKAD
jgi:polar amino acid transport system substrate-binding protein